MKTKHLFYSLMAAAVLAGCSNEELVSESFNKEAKMDATNFALVGNKGGVDSRIVTVPGYDADGAGTGTTWVIPAQQWEVDDEIGFSHIYTDQNIITNYKFSIADAADIDANGNALFTTTNSTIFEGDYFVYAPYNENYADYDGVPVEIPAVQTQNSATANLVQASEVLNSTTQTKFEAAVDHLTKFSISNRVAAEAQVNQQEFSLNEYTGTFYLKLYPVNQTQDIKVHRVEITCDGGFVTSGRFLAEQGKQAPVFSASEEKESSIVLLFDQMMTIPAHTLEKDAYMGYVSLLPATYENLKFKIYYTETGNLKYVEVDKPRIPLTSNTAIRINLPIDAHGAVEATSYGIYTEAEFAEAVAKSNAMNAGTNSEAKFTLMADLELNQSYTLEAKVPVTFEGDKIVTIKNGNDLIFKSQEDIVFDNVITTDESAGNRVLNQGKKVTIKGVDSDKLTLFNQGETIILNEEARGSLLKAINLGTLTLKNVDIANEVSNGTSGSLIGVLNLSDAKVGTDLIAETALPGGSTTLNNVEIVGKWTNTKGNISANTVSVGGDWKNTKGDLVAKNVTVAGSYTSEASAQTVAASMENVTVKGAFTQNGGELNLSDNNNLGWYTAVGGVFTSTGFSTTSKINVTAGTTTLGDAIFNEEANIAGTVEAKGITTLVNNKIVTVATGGKYIAKDYLDNLQDITMQLEGTLETEDVVNLTGNFAFCGTINNKATGKWSLNYAVSQHNHAHGSTAVFNNEGEVVVNDVTATTATAAIERMPKNIYTKVSNGRLVWKDMPNIATIATFAKLDADHCWASDFNAVVTGTTDNLSMTNSTTESWDWSAFNIIIDATSATHTATIASGKPLTVKNLKINLVSANLTLDYAPTTGQPTGLFVTEKMVITNAGTSTAGLEYTNCLTQTKDLEVAADATYGMKVNQAAAELKYTDTFTQINKPNINFVHGSPEKAN